MKKLLTTALLLASLSGMAQTLKYKAVVTSHYKGDLKSSVTTKYNTGTIAIASETIKTDSEDFTILKHGSTDNQDEGYTSKSLIVVTKGKTGAYKVMDCILLYTPKNALAEVIFKKTKSTVVSYVID